MAAKGLPPADANIHLDAVRRNWIEDQLKYFARHAGSSKSSAERLERVSTIIFRAGFFVITPAMLLIHGLKLGGEHLDPWMQVLTPSVFVIAGAINYYSERMLYSENAKQYSRMYGVFKKGIQMLDAAGNDPVRQQAVISAAGKEALAENGDWVLMYRERPIDVPQG